MTLIQLQFSFVSHKLSIMNFCRRPVLLTLGMLVAIGFVTNARAQFTNTYNMSSWNNPTSAFCDVLISQHLQRLTLGKAVENKYGKDYRSSPEIKRTSAPAKPKFPLARTDFKRTSPWLLPMTFAKSIPGSTPAQQKELSKAFVVVLDTVLKETKRPNLAYGLAVLIGVCIQIAYDVELPDAEFEQFAAGLNDVLAANPGLKRMSAKQKQQAYESMVLTMGLLQMLAELAKTENDEELGKTVKQLAKQAVDQFSKG